MPSALLVDLILDLRDSSAIKSIISELPEPASLT